jgi:hypothetical protein
MERDALHEKFLLDTAYKKIEKVMIEKHDKLVENVRLEKQKAENQLMMQKL